MAETKLHGDVHFCNTSGLHFPLPWTYERKKKQYEVPVCIKLLSLIFCRISSFYGTVHGDYLQGLCPFQVDYLIGRAKYNRRSSSAATRQTPSKKDLPLSLLMGPQFVRNQIQPYDPLLFVGIIFKKYIFWIL